MLVKNEAMGSIGRCAVDLSEHARTLLHLSCAYHTSVDMRKSSMGVFCQLGLKKKKIFLSAFPNCEGLLFMGSFML